MCWVHFAVATGICGYHLGIERFGLSFRSGPEQNPPVHDPFWSQVSNFLAAGKKVNAPAIKALQQKLSNHLVRTRNRSPRPASRSARGAGSTLRSTATSVLGGSGMHSARGMPRRGMQQEVHDLVPEPSPVDPDLDALQSGRRARRAGVGFTAQAAHNSTADQVAQPQVAHFSHGQDQQGAPQEHIRGGSAAGARAHPRDDPSVHSLPKQKYSRPKHALGLGHTGGLHHLPGGAGGGQRRFEKPEGKSTLEALRDEVLADPEPEVVEHVIQEVKARRAARKEAERRRTKQQAMLADIERAKAEKELARAWQAEEEDEFRRIEDERAAAENAREEQIKEGQRRKEAAQREERIRQIAEHQAALRAEKDSSIQQDRDLVKRSVDAAEKQDAAEKEDYVQRRAAMRQVMLNNEKLRGVKAQRKAEQQAADKKLMSDYNRMLDEQEEARKEALEVVYGRHETIHQMANKRKAMEKQRDEEEKARIRREYDAMMDRVKASEEEDRYWKAQERQAMKDALDAQVKDKQRRKDSYKHVEDRQRELFKSRAAAAAEEEAEERAAELKRKQWYQRQLDKQKDAKSRVAQREHLRKQAAAVARLAEIEDDESVLEEVAQQLVGTGRGSAAAGMTLTARGPRRDFGAADTQWREERDEMQRMLAR